MSREQGITLRSCFHPITTSGRLLWEVLCRVEALRPLAGKATREKRAFSPWQCLRDCELSALPVCKKGELRLYLQPQQGRNPMREQCEAPAHTLRLRGHKISFSVCEIDIRLE